MVAREHPASQSYCRFTDFLSGATAPRSMAFPDFSGALCAGASGGGIGTPASRRLEPEDAQDENANGSRAAMSAAKARSGRKTHCHREGVTIVPSGRSS